ncbi:hypothetical protein EV356DRAFT_446322 [Viridothelium virens]|uniref:Nucleoporin Nup120/160-domain-containing protein n=1 Tax=Viridothelium virens TaxID=1048519 RepID=A0A6A6H9Z5_VIRVR|nr:hypothetical protein EV356DRAFT_446322 [Viridothelium virens]
MTEPTLAYLFRETRLNLDPTSPTSTIQFKLLGSSSFSQARSQHVQKQTIDTADEAIDQSEQGFAEHHLADEASVFFRRESSSPRCISWRLLRSRTVLQLQVVDLTQKKGAEQEIRFTLRFCFPAAIRPFGIAFAELEEQDAFNIFALTVDKELYTLTIHKNFFISQSVTDSRLGDWCKIYTHPALTYRLPYRIFAVQYQEVLISLHDGGILRLEQVVKDGGWIWKDFIYAPGEGGWGASIRGLIPWRDHTTALFEDINLEPTTSAAISASPEGDHLFTVSLNYMLRIRDHKTGEVCAQVDLLSQEDAETRSNTRQLMGPYQRSLLQIVKPEFVRDGDLYYVVTYSPKDHQFKFWGVRDPGEAVNGIYDIHPTLKLVPPVDQLLDTSVWNLEEFYLRPKPLLQSTELWIRARVGATSQVFCLKFSLFDDDDFLQMTWKSNWTAVDGGSMGANTLKSMPQYPSLEAVVSFAHHADSITENALNFIFYPDRFTFATIESALYRYRTGLALPSSKTQYPLEPSKVPLKQRVCEAVAGKVSLRSHTSDERGGTDYGSYHTKVAEQWIVFAGLIIELHRRRTEVLSLAFDETIGLPWISLADYISPIRRCNEIETIQLNAEVLSHGEEALEAGPIVRSLQDRESVFVGCFLSAASAFRQQLPAPVKHTISVLASVEAFQDPFLTLNKRIENFYDRCALAEYITDDQHSTLLGSFDTIGGTTELNNDLFRRALGKLDSDTEGHEHDLSLMAYGERALIRGAQETYESGCGVLIDLLVLAVVMAMEFDENDLPNNFVPSEIFVEIMNRLREYELLRYLGSTTRIEPPPKERHSSISRSHRDSDAIHRRAEELHLPTVTLLWSIFIGDWKNISVPQGPDIPTSSLLTYWIRNWALGPDLTGNYDEIVEGIMGNLLVHRDFDLAVNFVPFLSSSPWPMYLKARLSLEQGRLVEAARAFKKAGFGLSRISKNKSPPGAEPVKDVELWDHQELLAPHEVHYFNEGNAGLYYQHIADLFERTRPQAWTYVAEFSRMALWHFDQKRFMRKEAESVNRLFTALIKTARWEEAYSTLGRFEKPDLANTSFSAHLESDTSGPTPSKARISSSSDSNSQYWHIVYAFRISRSDFRGAAEALWEWLDRLRASSRRADVGAPREQEIISRVFLLLINALACVQPEQAWLLAEAEGSKRPPGFAAPGLALGMKGKVASERRILTLEDVRAEYAMWLDRVAAVEQGRFAFVEGERDGDGDVSML